MRPQRRATLGKMQLRDELGYPKNVGEAMERAGKLDERRQEQIQNQIGIITRMKNDLQEANAEIYGLKVAVWCLLWSYTRDLAKAHGMPVPEESAQITIPRKDILEASAGHITAETDAEGNLTIRITKE